MSTNTVRAAAFGKYLDRLSVSPAAGFPRNCLQCTSFSWLLVFERFLSSPSSGLDPAGYLYLNAVSTTNSIPLLQGLRVRSFLRKLSVTDHVPCSSFGLSHFPHRRGNLYMFVFSDGIKLPHRHVTGSVSHQFLGAHLSLSMSVWCRFP